MLRFAPGTQGGPGSVLFGMMLFSISGWRFGAAAALLGAAAGAAAFGATALLPADGATALGVRIDGIPIPPGEPPHAAAEDAARRLLERRFSFAWGGEPVLDAPLEDLGATVDVERLAAQVAAVGREGTLLERIDEALEARRGHVDIALPVDVPEGPLADRLERFKEEHDAPPVAAKLDLAHHTATPHTPGRYLDVLGALAAVDRALEIGDRAIALPAPAIALPAFEIAPRASSGVVASIDTAKVVSRYETHFGYLGGQVGRAQNIARAAGEMEGVVLMPGDLVSFNANVGARSTDNGFAVAPEIFKGELREGVGGGTCQVAGTLHAAAFLGGIEVVERASHSRPSGYIPMGLDATVVYPTVDLKLRNPYDFPIVVHRSIDHGTLAFELLGRERPVAVTWSAETVGVADFKRRLEEAPSLPEGKFVLKQHGIRGYSIRKTRVIRWLSGGAERTEVTTDTYPPTFEIYQVPPGTEEDALPPLAAETPPPAEAEPAKPN
jgi:vancomycin resistance protein YoaR